MKIATFMEEENLKNRRNVVVMDREYGSFDEDGNGSDGGGRREVMEVFFFHFPA